MSGKRSAQQPSRASPHGMSALSSTPERCSRKLGFRPGTPIRYRHTATRLAGSMPRRQRSSTVLSLLHEAREHVLTSDLVLSMSQYYARSRDWTRWTVVLKLALVAALANGDAGAEAKLLQNMGIAAAQVGDRTEALARLHRAAELHRELGDLVGEARALAQLGSAHKDNGHLDDALVLQHAAQDLYRRAGDRDGGARALGDLANTLDLTGEHGRRSARTARRCPPFARRAIWRPRRESMRTSRSAWRASDDIRGAEVSMRHARDLFASLGEP